ncbi:MULTISPECIES: IclR family transcriptional regulator [unclassified Pseudomonas]|uniref:IclR family transcriptional regulator n=1 Tax=unclassified Pseudomonas TaxID=196821 RepID=UPI000BD2922F|nr:MULTISPECIES: IclR family transcriptional regulator [unclassified Pseudomonas]PVZ19706.1 IclR family transcriptional regulator [Pseudomonas sp. URIL14HWK12:I12]PVZ22709.1 IclR family transcriptional regulator [Pseudomonas sp. URIL14HWK12:I10]PVZ37661.1 IclR family transcriptional regulator [Pseudomonas sp. URIL14HWK12:I11]SNZ15426.1 transcriptional regulator, IclR family [Pseudomonas sp. URIL14HWK12:I9]
MSPQDLPTLTGESAATTRSLARAFQIMRVLALGQEHGMRLIDVVRHTGLSRPTVHRLLRALADEHAVEQDPATRRYRVGAEISMLALARPSRLPLRKLAEPHLQVLSDTLGDTAFITVRHGRDSVCLDRQLGSFPIKVMSIDVGTRRPLGVGVAGVVLLCAMADSEIDELLEMDHARLQACHLTAPEIKARVSAARAQGFVYAEQGVTHGTAALSVPVLGPSGEIVAALSVAAVASNLPPGKVAHTAAVLAGQAALISKRLSALGV